MYRVYLVDNEPWVLKGMEALMPWREHGFTVAASFTDPIAAYEAICQDPPDLVVVDIRMPEMDGLTLLHNARTQGVSSEFIIVSGYAEFEYAQSAMADHVYDYLLKPVEPEDMGRLLERLSATLSQRLQRERKRAAASLADCNDFRLLFADASHTHYLAARVRNVPYEGLTTLLDARHSPAYASFPHSAGGTVLLFAADHTLPAQARAAMEACAEAYPGARTGTSACTENPLALPVALEEADAAAYRDFIDENARCTVYQPIRTGHLPAMAHSIALYFVLRQYDHLIHTIRRVPADATSSGVCMDAIVDFWNRLAALVNTERASHAGQHEMSGTSATTLVQEYGTLKALCEYLEKALGSIVRKSAQVPRADGGDERFYDLLEDMSAHYDNKQLALRDLAKRHHLNISYCCKLFKRETGGTFSDYLIGLRLQHARRAMRVMGISATQVHSMVGYSDLYYFRRSYQKFFGETIE